MKKEETALPEISFLDMKTCIIITSEQPNALKTNRHSAKRTLTDNNSNHIRRNLHDLQNPENVKIQKLARHSFQDFRGSTQFLGLQSV